MNATAIVCEYNPFHTGHAYHIQEAKRLSNADTVIGLMSGFFVQRAEPAVVSPQLRAQAALQNGMDCVVELPTLFSCGAGALFAEGAMRTLSRIPCVNSIAMGIEDEGDVLKLLAQIQYEEPPEYGKTLKRCLGDGLPYPVAAMQATKAAVKTLSDTIDCEKILQKPNNLLAIEYLKAIRKLNLSVKPIFVKRQGNDYNDPKTSGQYISASAARFLLQNKRYDDLRPYIPADCLEALIAEVEQFPVRADLYNAVSLYALRTRDIAASLDAGEGLDRKIAESAKSRALLTQVWEDCKSKRYTMSRIKRICLQTLLQIGKDAAQAVPYALGRVIAVKKSRKDLLKNLAGLAVKNTDYAAAGKQAAAAAETDALAGGLYALLTNRSGNLFWDRKLLLI